jgi:aminopeptidase N
MRYIFLSFLLLFFSFWGSTQNSVCSKANHLNRKLKSTNLSNRDISRMNKYDITYVVIDLIVSSDDTQISGCVKHKGYFKSEVDSILLELHPDYIIDSIILNNTKINFLRKNYNLIVPNKHKIFELAIYYNGQIKSNQGQFMGGLGVVNGMDNYTKKKVTYTLSEPFSASDWWPSKQSLNDKIDSADLYFTTSNPNLVGSNGVLISKKIIDNGFTKFHWKTRYPTSYYLFSFSVGPYFDYSFKTHLPGLEDSLLIQNFIYSDSLVFKNSKKNIDLTKEFIKLYSTLFGVYPFYKEKYGHCLSTINGGMEHQTMTTLNSFDPYLVSHELAHQWFGNHITCSSFSDIWLNEGFATYSEYLMFEKLYPEKKDLLLGSYIQRAKKFKTGSVYVEDTLNESRIFSRELTYDKGALIIHTLRYLINNDSLFFKSLKEYQTKFSHSFASASDFKKIVEQICGIDLTIFFNEWYYGEGFPIYAIQTEKSSETKIHIQQSTSSSKTPLFTTPLELLIARENLPDTLIRVYITKNNEVLNFSNSLKLSYVKSIDPHNYILHETTPFLSLNELDSKMINVFPNPCQSELTIQINNPNSYRVRLINIDGQEVFNSILNSTYKLKTEEFKNGIYILEISNKKSVFSQKIIIDL